LDRAISFWKRVVEAGAFVIMAGSNSLDLKTTVLRIGG